MGMYYRFYVTLRPAMLFRPQVKKYKSNLYVKPANVASGWAYICPELSKGGKRVAKWPGRAEVFTDLLLGLDAVRSVLLGSVVLSVV